MQRVWWSWPGCFQAAGEEGKNEELGSEQLKTWLELVSGWNTLFITGEAAARCHLAAGLVGPALAAAVANAGVKGVQTCKLMQMDLSSDAAAALFAVLQSNPCMQRLSLQELNMEDAAAAALPSLLSACTTLCRMSLKRVYASDGAWRAWGKGLASAHCVQMTHLKLQGCLSHAAMTALTAAISVGALPQLEQLHVADCVLGQQPTSSSTTSSSSIRGAPSSSEGTPGAATAGCWDTDMAALLKALQQCGKLHSLSMTKAGLGVASAAAMGNLLKLSKALSVVRASGNPSMGALGCCELVSGIRRSKTLMQLDMQATGMDDTAMSALCKALWWQVAPIRVLLLGHNLITGAGAQLLGSYLAKHATVEEVSLAGCAMVADAGAEALAALLVSPKCRLRRLDLRSCEVADTGAAALAGKLAAAASRLAAAGGKVAGPSSRGLQELDLSDNQITAAGIQALASALAAAGAHCTLRRLDVSFNWTGPAGMAPLAQLSTTHTAHRTGQRSQPGGAAVHGASTDAGRRRGSAVSSAANCQIITEVLLEYRQVEQIKQAAAAAVSADAATAADPYDELDQWHRSHSGDDRDDDGDDGASGDASMRSVSSGSSCPVMSSLATVSIGALLSGSSFAAASALDGSLADSRAGSSGGDTGSPLAGASRRGVGGVSLKQQALLNAHQAAAAVGVEGGYASCAVDMTGRALQQQSSGDLQLHEQQQGLHSRSNSANMLSMPLPPTIAGLVQQACESTADAAQQTQGSSEAATFTIYNNSSFDIPADVLAAALDAVTLSPDDDAITAADDATAAATQPAKGEVYCGATMASAMDQHPTVGPASDEQQAGTPAGAVDCESTAQQAGVRRRSSSGNVAGALKRATSHQPPRPAHGKGAGALVRVPSSGLQVSNSLANPGTSTAPAPPGPPNSTFSRSSSMDRRNRRVLAAASATAGCDSTQSDVTAMQARLRRSSSSSSSRALPDVSGSSEDPFADCLSGSRPGTRYVSVEL